MKNSETQQLLNIVEMAILISTIASFENSTLAIRDLLKAMPDNLKLKMSDVGDELQEIVNLSYKVADKLGISEQVIKLRNLQEAQITAIKESNRLALDNSKEITNLTDSIKNKILNDKN